MLCEKPKATAATTTTPTITTQRYGHNEQNTQPRGETNGFTPDSLATSNNNKSHLGFICTLLLLLLFFLLFLCVFEKSDRITIENQCVRIKIKELEMNDNNNNGRNGLHWRKKSTTRTKGEIRN